MSKGFPASVGCPQRPRTAFSCRRVVALVDGFQVTLGIWEVARALAHRVTSLIEPS